MKKPKLKGEGWEVVFVSHKLKKKPSRLPTADGQFVSIYYNGKCIGLVQEFKLQGEEHGFSMTLKIPLFGHAIHELKDANP